MVYLSPNQKLGLAGEMWAKARLENKGYSVQVYPDFNEREKDLLVNGVLPCEVKISREGDDYRKTSPGTVKRYPRWEWKLSGLNGKDKLVILIAIDHLGFFYAFVCPSAIFVHRQSAAILSHPTRYTGYMSPFLGAWGTVDYLLEKRYLSHGQLSVTGWLARCQEVSRP